MLFAGQVDNCVTLLGSRWTSQANDCSWVYIWSTCSWYKSGQIHLFHIIQWQFYCWMMHHCHNVIVLCIMQITTVTCALLYRSTMAVCQLVC